MKKLLFCFCILSCIECYTMILSQPTYYKGRQYYIDVQTNYRGDATIWFRVHKNGFSMNDFRVMTILSQRTNSYDEALSMCSTRQTIDNGTKAIGCLATIGSGVCAGLTAEEGGVFVCTAIFEGTIELEAAQCLDLVSDQIANHLSIGPFQKLFIRGQFLVNKLHDVANTAIDVACEHLRQNAPRYQNNNQVIYYQQPQQYPYQNMGQDVNNTIQNGFNQIQNTVQQIFQPGQLSNPQNQIQDNTNRYQNNQQPINNNQQQNSTQQNQQIIYKPGGLSGNGNTGW
jgi:hypothetical protein